MSDIKKIKELVQKSSDIIICLMNNPSIDAMASGLGLYHALKTSEYNVTIASAATINTGGLNLPGSEEISNKIGNRNLVITLQVENRESIDKVSYNLSEDGTEFDLIIQPKKGAKSLKDDQVKYSYTGTQADIIIVIDTYNFQELGSLYEGEKKAFSESKTINITHNNITKFTDFHISDNKKSSISEIVAQLIEEFELKKSKDTATNLLAGIDAATNKLQSPTTQASTFDAVAKLIRDGGTRQQTNTSSPTPPNPPTSQAATAQPQPTTPQSNQEKNQVPKDWLSPKIYKGSGGSKG